MTARPRRNSRAGSVPSRVDLLNLVEQLSNFDQIGVTRLARHLEIPVPTAYRMLRALERAGYVEQLAESKEYRLTLKLFELGSRVASRTTLRDLAAVEVERLALQAGLASNVSVLVEREVLYLAQVKTEELLAVNLTPGSRAPATCTAMGKAMLAADFRYGTLDRRTRPLPAPDRVLAYQLRGAVHRAGRDPAPRLRRGPAGTQPRRVVRGRADPRGQADPARRGERLRLPPPPRTRPRRSAWASWSSPPRAASPTGWRPRQHGLLSTSSPARRRGDSCRAAHAAPRRVPVSLTTATASGGLTLKFSQDFSADHFVLGFHQDSTALAMSPLAPGLAMTCCRARHRWDIRAKPRSPW